MLTQRTINLTQDEVLIIKTNRNACHLPIERPHVSNVETLAVRIICDKAGALHVLAASRAFATLHIDPRQDEIPLILNPAEHSAINT